MIIVEIAAWTIFMILALSFTLVSIDPVLASSCSPLIGIFSALFAIFMVGDKWDNLF